MQNALSKSNPNVPFLYRLLIEISYILIINGWNHSHSIYLIEYGNVQFFCDILTDILVECALTPKLLTIQKEHVLEPMRTGVILHLL